MLHGMLMLGERPRPSLYRLLTLGEMVDLPVYLNFYDIMMMIAQKPVPAVGAPSPAAG